MRRIILAAGIAGLAAWSVYASEALGGSRPTRQPESFVNAAAVWPVRGDLGAGLGRLKASLVRCAGAEGAADAGRPDAGEETVLRLEIETLDGGLRIVDAPPAGEGARESRSAACARQVLRGQVVPSRLARAGRSFEVPFALEVD